MTQLLLKDRPKISLETIRKMVEGFRKSGHQITLLRAPEPQTLRGRHEFTTMVDDLKPFDLVWDFNKRYDSKDVPSRVVVLKNRGNVLQKIHDKHIRQNPAGKSVPDTAESGN